MKFADIVLARRLEGSDAAKYAAYTQARTAMLPDLRGDSLAVAGGYAFFAGADSPYSRAVGLGLHGPVSDAEFSQVAVYYSERGAPLQVTYCPLADRSLLAQVNAHNCRPQMFMNVWWRTLDAGETRTALPAGVRVRLIEPSEADLWVRVAYGGGLDSDDAQPDRTAIVAAYPHMADTRCYLAWLEDEPAGAATLGIHDGTASLFGTSTRPRCRNRGVQHALITARLADAASAGCDLAVVHTEPGSPSQRNVERLDFRLAYTKMMMQSQDRICHD